MTERALDPYTHDQPKKLEEQSVLPDFVSKASIARDSGDLEKARATTAMQSNAVVQLLEGRTHEEIEKPEKAQRKKAFEWMKAVNNMLLFTAGHSLEDFRTDVVRDKDVSADPTLWRTLVIAADQGADGVASAFFMMKKLRLCMVPHWDMAHRAWNDGKQALQAANAWDFALSATVVLNFNSAPFGSGAFHVQAQSAAKELVEAAEQEDNGPITPSFTTSWMPSLRSVGWRYGAVMTPCSKGSSMQFWQPISTRAAELTQTWSAKCAALLHLAVAGRDVAVNEALRAKLQAHLKTPADEGQTHDDSTAFAPDRVKAKNCDLLSMALVFLLDPKNKACICAMTEVLRPLRVEYKEIVERNKSAEESARMFAQWANGGAFR
eukprot:6457435-Amphidinium_carterae.1